MEGDILIHLGLPKTGTTAIQRTLHAGGEQLEQAGLCYPEPHSLEDPKHQGLVNGLLKGDHQNLESHLAACPETLTPVFSAEGLSNHLFDFPPHSLAGFRSCLSGHRVKGILVSRTWSAWLKSYFKQCIVNPPSKQWTHYGFSGDVRAFEQHERVRRFASFDRLVESIAQRLGVAHVDVIEYSPDIVSDILTHLGIDPTSIPPVAVANSSLSDVAAECVRQVNGLVRDGRSRRQWVKRIAEVDQSTSTVAHAAKPGDESAAMDVGVWDQLVWMPDSGLEVTEEAFELFRTLLSERIDRELEAIRS